MLADACSHHLTTPPLAPLPTTSQLMMPPTRRSRQVSTSWQPNTPLQLRLTSSSQPSSSTSSSTSPATASTSFQLFTSLPPELRLKIWVLALPSTRLVPLTYISSSLTPHLSTIHPSRKGCTSVAEPPVTLSICRESRTVAQEHYILSFALEPILPSKTWFSFPDQRGVEDILYFGPQDGDGGGTNASLMNFISPCSILTPQSLSHVRRLAVHTSLFLGTTQTELRNQKRAERPLLEFWEKVMSKFEGVEMVYFCRRPGVWLDGRNRMSGEGRGVDG
jgi:hypothetical protein